MPRATLQSALLRQQTKPIRDTTINAYLKLSMVYVCDIQFDYAILLSNTLIIYTYSFYHERLACICFFFSLQIRQQFQFNKFITSITSQMYTGFKPNNSVSKTVVSGLGETQLETLQREVDTYTRKLQQEKKKLFSIQDTHKIVTDQYQKQKAKLDELKKQNSKAQNVIVQAKIKNLEAGLEKAVSTYDETMAHNLKLKGEIDMLRREKKNHIQSKAILKQQIENHEKEIKSRLVEIQEKKNTAESLKTNIIKIKEKNERERQMYIDQFNKLQQNYLKQKRERQMFKFEKDQKPQPIDTQPLLKHRLKKLIKSNKNKIKMIEQYKKHMKQIQQAFNEIKKSSGIEDLNEITNTFIKSEEQNYSLYNYMDSLSRNIDSLEKANAELQERIINQEKNDVERKRNLEQMPAQQRRRKELEQYVLKKQEANQALQKVIESVKPSLASALIELANSQLNDDPSKIAEYQLGININDRTIEGYLSDLQKFINNLLILKQEAKPKLVSSIKDNVTIYTKPLPNFTPEEIVVNKEKLGEPKDEQKLMQQGRFRQYAIEYWEKKRSKGNNSKQ